MEYIVMLCEGDKEEVVYKTPLLKDAIQETYNQLRVLRNSKNKDVNVELRRYTSDVDFETVEIKKNEHIKHTAVSKVDDEHFTKGKRYECTNAYVIYDSPFIGVLDNHGDVIATNINDYDFDKLVAAHS